MADCHRINSSETGQKTRTTAVSAVVEDVPADEPPAPAPPPRPVPPVKQENRRKHPRTKVSYKAGVRRSGFTDDVVSCEDMSRGGICFKSRKRYFESAEIEVAVPYAPGANAIFVPASIVWVKEIENDKQYKCGVAYRITSRAS